MFKHTMTALEELYLSTNNADQYLDLTKLEGSMEHQLSVAPSVGFHIAFSASATPIESYQTLLTTAWNEGDHVAIERLLKLGFDVTRNVSNSDVGFKATQSHLQHFIGTVRHKSVFANVALNGFNRGLVSFQSIAKLVRTS